MESTFGTILVIVVTGVVIGIVIPMMVNLILREIEGYQKRRAVRSGKVAIATIEAVSKGFITIGESLDKVMKNEKTVDEYYEDLKKMADEASKNHENDFEDLD